MFKVFFVHVAVFSLCVCVCQVHEKLQQKWKFHEKKSPLAPLVPRSVIETLGEVVATATAASSILRPAISWLARYGSG